MISAINTLIFVRALQHGGIVPHIPGPHQAEVTIPNTTFRRNVQIYLADPLPDGAPMNAPPVGHTLRRTVEAVPAGVRLIGHADVASRNAARPDGSRASSKRLRLAGHPARRGPPDSHR
jgi:hypothetical protein